MNPFIQNALIFGAFCLSMLAKDIVYTVETKADASGRTFVAAVADPIGDGLASITNIFTIAIVSAGLTHFGEIAQIAGNMTGGFIGVFAGSWVSLMLDRKFVNYHKRPSTHHLIQLFRHHQQTSASVTPA